jgi:hypothetical protein
MTEQANLDREKPGHSGLSLVTIGVGFLTAGTKNEI